MSQTRIRPTGRVKRSDPPPQRLAPMPEFCQVNKAVNQSVFPKYCELHQHRREPADPAIRRHRDAQVAGARETLRVTEQQVTSRRRYLLYEFVARPVDPRS